MRVAQRRRVAKDHVLSVSDSASFDYSALAAFFAKDGRDLPWRASDATPWAVLVSELMLQQTPVGRVLPVYAQWMRQWPTPAHLAAASAGDAVRAWGTLGYPRRALRLHETATRIVTDHAGMVPTDVGVLLQLPGVGEYTARAVAVFAFGQRHAVVDTNVRRVLCRAVRGVDEHGPATATDRADVAELLPNDPAEARTVSAAVMELGALYCTIRDPDCARCPLKTRCAWRTAGYPPGPARTRPAQRWHGTDRQVRGRILAKLRGSKDAVSQEALAADMTSYLNDPTQWQRCLDSLLRDGLAVRYADATIGLPT